MLKTPIFVFTSDGDVLGFNSESEAGSYLESTDVENGEYALALDAEGMELAISVVAPTRKGTFLGIGWMDPKPVMVTENETAHFNADKLRELLVKALIQRGNCQIDPAEESLAKIVEIAAVEFACSNR